MSITDRRTIYEAASTQLALLNNQQLVELLEKATLLSTGIGGTSFLLKLNETPIFVKKVPLTDLEKQPENMMSTANFFGLPTYFQYGIGSPGFGVWRELATHIMTTQWALTGECTHFPFMYHWRNLPRTIIEKPTDMQLNQLEKEVEYWGGSPAVRARYEAILNASADIVLFLEYFPENLHQWLKKQLIKDNYSAETAFTMVEKNLRLIISFINAHDLLHFDAHFKNILTDGRQLYFADFGLALSKQFDLSKAELDFYDKHQNYDRCYTLSHLVRWTLVELYGEENYDSILQEYTREIEKEGLPSIIAPIIKRYLPLAIEMNEFYKRLKIDKTLSYPSDNLEIILKGIL